MPKVTEGGVASLRSPKNLNLSSSLLIRTLLASYAGVPDYGEPTLGVPINWASSKRAEVRTELDEWSRRFDEPWGGR